MIEVKNILPKIKASLALLRKYAVGITVVIILLIYGYLVFKIGTISAVEPNEEAVTEQLLGTQRLKIDQEAIDKIEQLEDQNINVRSLFKAARNNPFQEN